MGVFVHLRDRLFRVSDQGVLPVPLDPDLLFLAENAKQSNIIQELYRTQMERNRSRGPFGDAFEESEHPRDPGGQFTSGAGAAEKPADDWHHRTSRSKRHKHAEHEAAAERSREAWDKMSPAEQQAWFKQNPGKARVLARKNRGPYDEPHMLVQHSNGKFSIKMEHEHYGGSMDPYFTYHWKQHGDQYANRETAERHFKQRTDRAAVEQEAAEKEARRKADWEAGEPQRAAERAKREAATAKAQGERAKKEAKMPAHLQRLKSVIEKLPDEGKKGFAQSLIDRYIEKGSLTPAQEPWVTKLLDLAEHGVTKDPAIQKTAEKLEPIKHKLTGRDLEAAESMLEQFNSRGTLSERQQSYFESLLRKANRTGDADEWEEHEHPRNKGGQFTAKGGEGTGGKVPSAAPEGAPKAEQPALAPLGGQEQAVAELSPWMKRHGFKFNHYDEGTGQVTYGHYDGTLVTFRKAGDDWIWTYKPEFGGAVEGSSWGRLEEILEHRPQLEGHEEEYERKHVNPLDLIKGKMPNSTLNDMLDHGFRLDRYDENSRKFVFRHFLGGEIEYAAEASYAGQGKFWQHTDTANGRRYMGNGNTSLAKHLKNQGAGEYADYPLSKHYAVLLTIPDFKLSLETAETSMFQNRHGDQVYLYKASSGKPEDANWKVYIKHEENASGSQYNEGKGWGELKSTLRMLNDAHREHKEQVDKVRTQHHADIREQAVPILKKNHYPVKLFRITDEDYEFTLNGARCFAAGSANLQTGEVTLYAKQLPYPNQVAGIMAHEVMHQKFQKALDEYDEEHAESIRDNRDIWNIDGSLKPEFSGDYPVMAKIAGILIDRKKLQKSDGVTAYSREWWQEYANGQAKIDQAIHETLAEMAMQEETGTKEAIRPGTPDEYIAGRKLWQKLYDDVNSLYRTHKSRENHKYDKLQKGGAPSSRSPSTPTVSPSPAPAGVPLPQAPAGVRSGLHPAVTQFAQALKQILSLGDAEFKEEEHPRGGDPEHPGRFSSAEGGGSESHTKTETASTSAPKPKQEYKNEAERLHFEGSKKTALPKSAEGSHPATISTRRPTHVKAVEGDEYRRVDIDAMRQDPENFEHDVDLFRNEEQYPNFRPNELDCSQDAKKKPAESNEVDTKCTEHRARAIIDHMKKNLRFLYDNAPEQVVKEGHKWYEGAHRLAEEDAAKYEIPVPSVVGAYAALSPQNLWDMNVSQAKRIFDTYFNKQHHKWDEKMGTTGERLWIAKKTPASPQAAKNAAQKAAIYNIIKGKTLAEMKTPVQKAMWIRTYDEAHNPQSFDSLSPDGRVIGTYLTSKKKPQKNSWHTTGSIANAIISIESGGDRDVISPAMGNQHKVRSFYNNILDPDSDNDDVTMDTHAVGAALLSPMGQSHTAVIHSLGSKPATAADARRMHYVAPTGNSLTGMHGTYPLYAEAYRELATDLGIKPRVLQSITWEAKRRLFDRELTDEQSNKVYALWRDYHDGKADLEATQKAVVEAAGGFSKGQEGLEGDNGKDTGKRPAGKGTPRRGHTGDSRELHPSQLGFRTARTVDSGRRGRDTARVTGGARRLWQSARLAVFLH